MKFEDVKWAFGELVSSALRPRHVDCECHPGLTYGGPKREVSPPEREAGKKAPPAEADAG